MVMHVAARTAIVQTRIPAASPIIAGLESPELGIGVGVADGNLVITVLVDDAAVALVTVAATVVGAVGGRRAV